MTINAQEQLTAARAYIYLSDVGTVAPADETEEPGVGWTNVGLTTPDSLSFADEPEFQSINSHQSDYETRRIHSTQSASLSVDLQQWNSHNLKAVYGGGTITEPVPSSGSFKFTPPSLGARAEKAAIIDVIDGLKRYRWVFPRTQQVEGVTTELQKGVGANLPLRLAVLGDDAGEPWYLLTNDPSFAVAP